MSVADILKRGTASVSRQQVLDLMLAAHWAARASRQRGDFERAAEQESEALALAGIASKM